MTAAFSLRMIAMTDLTNPIFTDEKAARKHLESLRWADGRFCPHCGETEKTSYVRGKKHRPGLYYCNGCKSTFTVTVGTVFERSKIPLHKWMLGYHLMVSSKKGISAHQLHRMLGLTYKTAWFMAHRIRESMKDENPTPMGGSGISVEADETFIGRTTRARKRAKRFPTTKWKGSVDKMKVVSLVERGGPIRSFKVDRVNSATVQDILFRNISRKSHLLTDEAKIYMEPGAEFASHKWVTHSHKEYARGFGIHVNTLEGYFSIFKRGMKGVYQHCGEQHLQRYLVEFDFRFNNREIEDAERRDKALAGSGGKRLTYQQPNR